MRDNENISETGMLQKAGRASVLDYHIDEIKKYRKLKLNATAIHKMIQNKIPGGISYNGVLSYIKRNKL